MDLLAWLNSIQARIIGFALGVILLVTAVSFAIAQLSGPARTPVSIYDLAKVMRGARPAQSDLAKQFKRFVRSDMPDHESAVEARLAGILARELDISGDDVRLHLGNRSDTYFDYLRRQLDNYDRDGRASPIVSGRVTAAVRRADARWEVFDRPGRPGRRDPWQLLRASPWLGALLVIPLGLWFGTLLARPVRDFARAARRAGDGRAEVRVPVAGPTEIRIAAEALNEMQARIGNYMQERTALVAAIAHDLRTPLNSLRFRLAGAPPAVRDPAEKDVEQLDALINAILDYVESDKKILKVEPIDLTSLIQSIIDDLLSELDVDMEHLDELKIEGDILLLRRLFSNLLLNAAKFATQVYVRVQADSSNAIVEIADNGPGMSPADLSLAFEPFFRGERSRSRSTGGVGLGLSIVKSTVEAHGGTVELTNRPAGGLLARVALPMRQSEMLWYDGV
jgi:two-component system, OmpR family, sensor kinase